VSTSAFAPLPLRAPSSQLRSASIFFSGAQHVEASFGACVSVNNNDDDNDDVRFLRDGGMDANGPRLSVVVVLVFVISRSPKRLAYLHFQTEEDVHQPLLSPPSPPTGLAGSSAFQSNDGTLS
jgi:hypothetical protein